MATKERFWDCELTLKPTKRRARHGCDWCKKDHATECFVGYCGNVLWLCSKGMKALKERMKK